MAPALLLTDAAALAEPAGERQNWPVLPVEKGGRIQQAGSS